MDEDKQEAIESIMTALGHRFDDIPADLTQRLETLDVDAIDGLWEVTFDAASMDVVIAAVAQAGA